MGKQWEKMKEDFGSHEGWVTLINTKLKYQVFQMKLLLAQTVQHRMYHIYIVEDTRQNLKHIKTTMIQMKLNTTFIIWYMI